MTKRRKLEENEIEKLDFSGDITSDSFDTAVPVKGDNNMVARDTILVDRLRDKEGTAASSNSGENLDVFTFHRFKDIFSGRGCLRARLRCCVGRWISCMAICHAGEILTHTRS